MSILVPPSARARGSISSLTPAGPQPISRSPDVTDLKHRLQAVGYFDASVWSDQGRIGVWLNDASGIGVNLVKQDGNVTSYDVMIRENVSVARFKNVEAAVLRVVIERQNFARQAKEGRFKGEYSLPRADQEFGGLLVVIYPERACALANERLGRGAASKARTALKAVLRSWSGNVLTVESWKDNAKLWDYPGFMDVIDESLWRNMDAGYATNTVRERATKPSNLTQLIRRQLLNWGTPATTPIYVTGAFYRHDGRGWVHQFRRDIQQLGYEGVRIGPGAIVDTRSNVRRMRASQKKD